MFYIKWVIFSSPLVDRERYILAGKKYKVTGRKSESAAKCPICQNYYNYLKKHLVKVHQVDSKLLRDLKIPKPEEDKFYQEFKEQYLCHR